MTRQTVHMPGTIKKLSLAVIVDGNYEPKPDAKGKPQMTFVGRSPQELKSIEEVVKKSVGFNEARGDQINVSNIPFAGNPNSEENATSGIMKDSLHVLKNNYRIILNLVLTVLVFFFIVPAVYAEDEEDGFWRGDKEPARSAPESAGGQEGIEEGWRSGPSRGTGTGTETSAPESSGGIGYGESRTGHRDHSWVVEGGSLSIWAGKLSGPHKAAITLLALGEETSAVILKKLTTDEIKQLGLQMSFIQGVKKETSDELLQEFAGQFNTDGDLQVEGDQFIRKLLPSVLDGESANEVMSQDRPGEAEGPFQTWSRNWTPGCLRISSGMSILRLWPSYSSTLDTTRPARC